MKREIKFRAWNWEKMIEPLDLDTMLRKLSDRNFNWLILDDIRRNNDCLKWLQYTWLKDRNWKEIYEGDIIEVSYWLHIVNFNQGIWCFNAVIL